MSNIFGCARVAVAVLVMCTIAVSTPSPANAQSDSIFQRAYNFMFKRDAEDRPRPEETLRAPFIDPAQEVSPTADAMNLPYSPMIGAVHEDTSDLRLPHRYEEQIGAWLTSSLSELLNFDPGNYDVHVNEALAYMDTYALSDFHSFLQETGLLNRLNLTGTVLRSYVSERPFLVNEGAAEGRYRWLMQVPVTLTLLPRGMQDYSKHPNPETHHYIISTQIGRTDRTADGMLIENMRVRPGRN